MNEKLAICHYLSSVLENKNSIHSIWIELKPMDNQLLSISFNYILPIGFKYYK
jgi:hypothetical protein